MFSKKSKVDCKFYDSPRCPKGLTQWRKVPKSQASLFFCFFGCWNSLCKSGKVKTIKFEAPDEEPLYVSEKLKSSHASLQSFYKVKNETYGEAGVLAALKQLADKTLIDAVILTGDNVYEMFSVDEAKRESWAREQIAKWLENPKTFPSPGQFYDIQKALEYGFRECFKGLHVKEVFVTLGNHDVENCQILNEEMNYHQGFGLFGTYYDVVYQTSKFKAQLIMLDTNMFSSKMKEKKGKMKEKFQKTCSSEEFSNEDRKKQAAWVMQRIQEEKADWVILFGHVPLHAIGHKATYPHVYNRLLDDFIFKPIEQLQLPVHLYICADEHNQQFLYESKRKLSLVVIGSGGATLDSGVMKQPPLKSSKFTMVTHGFGSLTLTAAYINVTFWKVDLATNTAGSVQSFVIDRMGNLQNKKRKA